MDELDLLASARPVPPPTAATTSAARMRLAELIAAETPAPVADVPRRRRFRLPRWSLIPAMAAVLALAVALTMAWGGPAAPDDGDTFTFTFTGDGGPPPSQLLRNLLLAAADRAADDTVADGRYWVSQVESGQLLEVGSAGARYAIMGRTDVTTWYTTRGGDRALYFRQWVGGAPASDADRTAWQRAGSPTSWPVEVPPNCPARPYSYTDGRGELLTVVAKPGASTFTIAGARLTAKQVRGLPTDPVQLKTWMLRTIHKGYPDLKSAADLSRVIFDAMINLLYQAPSTPAVRAAAYRLMADLPGLHDLGPSTDAKGRPGNAVTVVTNVDEPGVHQADRGGPMENRVIFDPQSGEPLAWETRVMHPADYLSWVPTGALFSYSAITQTRWTDDTPPPPTPHGPADTQPATC